MDILDTITGSKDIFTVDHLLAMRRLAIVSNVGHFDSRIDISGLERLPWAKRSETKPQVQIWVLPNGKSVLVLSVGRLMSLDDATGHPSFVTSNSFANQVLTQIKPY